MEFKMDEKDYILNQLKAGKIQKIEGESDFRINMMQQLKLLQDQIEELQKHVVGAYQNAHNIRKELVLDVLLNSNIDQRSEDMIDVGGSSMKLSLKQSSYKIPKTGLLYMYSFTTTCNPEEDSVYGGKMIEHLKKVYTYAEINKETKFLVTNFVFPNNTCLIVYQQIV